MSDLDHLRRRRAQLERALEWIGGTAEELREDIQALDREIILAEAEEQAMAEAYGDVEESHG